MRPSVGRFLLTMGAVEVVLGGLHYHWPLVAFGLGTAGLALGWQGWRGRPRSTSIQSRPLYLPPASSRPQVPSLDSLRRRS